MSSIISATISAATSPVSSSAFTNLPTELRLAIYQLALQDILDTMILPTIVNSDSTRHAYQGALALLHTNGPIREEAARELLPIGKARFERAKGIAESFARSSKELSWKEPEAVRYAKRVEQIVGNLMVQLQRACVTWEARRDLRTD